MAEKRQRERKQQDQKFQERKPREKKPQSQPERLQESDETTSEMIAGKNPVLEALRSGREINKLWIAEGVKKSEQHYYV